MGSCRGQASVVPQSRLLCWSHSLTTTVTSESNVPTTMVPRWSNVGLATELEASDSWKHSETDRERQLVIEGAAPPPGSSAATLGGEGSNPTWCFDASCCRLSSSRDPSRVCRRLIDKERQKRMRSSKETLLPLQWCSLSSHVEASCAAHRRAKRSKLHERGSLSKKTPSRYLVRGVQAKYGWRAPRVVEASSLNTQSLCGSVEPCMRNASLDRRLSAFAMEDTVKMRTRLQWSPRTERDASASASAP